MADKVQLIKEEIERRIENLKISLDKNCVTEESKLDIRGNITTLYGLLDFIGSLPEEPKKQPKFRVGDTIKGPCNNVFQVKEVLDTQYLLHSENGDELNSIEIVDKYSCLEEPVSEGLEEELHSWMRENCDDNGFFNQLELARHFAEWQKQQMVNDAFIDDYIVHDGRIELEGEPLPSVEPIILLPYPKFKPNDKVKIIIVKEE